MGCGKLCLIICVAVCFIVVSLPLGITSIVLATKDTQYCDYVDQMGLDVKQYLLGAGIVSVTITSIIVCFLFTFVCSEKLPMIGIAVAAIVNTIFGLIWFIIGGVILFRSNLDCMTEGSVPVIYALVLWCISAASCFIG